MTNETQKALAKAERARRNAYKAHRRISALERGELDPERFFIVLWIAVPVFLVLLILGAEFPDATMICVIGALVASVVGGSLYFWRK